MTNDILRIKQLTADAIVPTRANPSDSGLDLYAAEDIVVEPGATAIVKTGIAIALPAGYEAQIRPRSGITAKTKLRVQLGTIDESYRGELGIIVDNIAQDKSWVEGVLAKAFFWFKRSDTFHVKTIKTDVTSREFNYYPDGTYRICKGNKLAQLVIAPYATPTVEIVDELDATDRGGNGFGSTGVGV